MQLRNDIRKRNSRNKPEDIRMHDQRDDRSINKHRDKNLRQRGERLLCNAAIPFILPQKYQNSLQQIIHKNYHKPTSDA